MIKSIVIGSKHVFTSSDDGSIKALRSSESQFGHSADCGRVCAGVGSRFAEVRGDVLHFHVTRCVLPSAICPPARPSLASLTFAPPAADAMAVTHDGRLLVSASDRALQVRGLRGWAVRKQLTDNCAGLRCGT